MFVLIVACITALFLFVAGNRNAILCLSIHQLMEVRVVFIFIIVNNTTMNNCAQDFMWTCVSISRRFGARSRELGPRVTLCLIC